ncbi:hypothetical protein CsSME_00028435 [Camellia sinensis var. sinensis]
MEALHRLRVALVLSVVAHFSLLAKSSSFSSQEFQIVNVESRSLNSSLNGYRARILNISIFQKERYGVYFQKVCTFIMKNNEL